MFDINKAKEAIEKSVLMWRYLYGCAVYGENGITEKDLDTAISTAILDFHKKLIKHIILSLTKDEQVSLIKVFINNEPLSLEFIEKIGPIQEECLKYNEILLSGDVEKLQSMFDNPEQMYNQLDSITDKIFEQVFDFLYKTTENIDANIFKKIILSVFKMKFSIKDIYGLYPPKL